MRSYQGSAIKTVAGGGRRAWGRVALACTLLLAWGSSARAGWTEVGDAGQLLSTAQVPTAFSPGAIGFIDGVLSNDNDVDMYKIYHTGGSFSASTSNLSGGGDPNKQLFLFNASGFGVAANDTALSNDASLSISSLAAGEYYLAISSSDNNPVSSTGSIFSFPFLGVGSDNPPPSGPGAGNPLIGWGTGSSNGNYRINLGSSVEYASVVPEPGSLALLGLGAAGLVGFRLRRSRAMVVKA